MRFGMGELVIILAIALLLFGAKKLPELASGMGKAIKNFKRGLEGDDEIDVTPEDKRVQDKSSAQSVAEATTDAEVIEEKNQSKSG